MGDISHQFQGEKVKITRPLWVTWNNVDAVIVQWIAHGSSHQLQEREHIVQASDILVIKIILVIVIVSFLIIILVII